MYATQSTDLDRIDNFHPVTAAAAAGRRIFGEWTERALVTAAKDGDEAATLELISRYEARLRRMVARANIGEAAVPDLQQSAMLGVLEALRKTNPDAPEGFFTFAHNIIGDELHVANREVSAKPAEKTITRYYWAAMNAMEGDAVRARVFTGLHRLSVDELEPLAEDGDVLAREVIDARYDRWERKPNGREWADVAAERGRGLDGPTFDAVHASVTYIDGATAGDDDGEALSLHETIAATDVDQTEAIENEMTVAALVVSLPDRDAFVVSHLFGVNGAPKMTAAQVAEYLGITRPRVQNVKADALRKLVKIGGDFR